MERKKQKKSYNSERDNLKKRIFQFFLYIVILNSIIFFLGDYNILASVLLFLFLILIFVFEKNKKIALDFFILMAFFGGLFELIGTGLNFYKYSTPFLFTIPLWNPISWGISGILAYIFCDIIKKSHIQIFSSFKQKTIKHLSFLIPLGFYALITILYIYAKPELFWQILLIYFIIFSLLLFIIDFNAKELVIYSVVFLFSYAFEIIMVRQGLWTFYYSDSLVPLAAVFTYSFFILITMKIIKAFNKF